MLFEGRVFALDKETMIYGTCNEKRKHLLSILTAFIKEQVEELIPDDGELLGAAAGKPKPIRQRKKHKPTVRNRKAGPISRQELKDFLRIDIPLLSKKNYFERCFGQLPAESEQES